MALLLVYPVRTSLGQSRLVVALADIIFRFVLGFIRRDLPPHVAIHSVCIYTSLLSLCCANCISYRHLSCVFPLRVMSSVSQFI